MTMAIEVVISTMLRTEVHVRLYELTNKWLYNSSTTTNSRGKSNELTLLYARSRLLFY